MKKIFSISMAFILFISLSACKSIPERHATGKEIFKNVNARLAVSMGFDKEFIVNDIYGNGSYAADYFVPRAFVMGPNGTKFEGRDFRDDADDILAYNPDKAAEYWDKAKEELQFTTASIELLMYDTESALKVGEHIKEELELHLSGVEVILKPMPFAEKLRLADEGEFEFNWSGWGPDYSDPMTFIDMWVTGGGFNEAGWTNEEFDTLIERSKSGDLSSDLEARWQALIDAEKILLENAVIAPIYQRNGISLQNPDLDFVYRHQFGPDFSWKWTDIPAVDGKKVLNLVETSDIPTLDTSKATDSVSFEVMNNIQEGLFRLGENDKVELGVVKSYTVSEDGLTYTFILNEESKWVTHEGKLYGNVTAHDFVFSWDRLVAEDTAAQYAFMAETAQLSSYEAIDDYTLVVNLNAPVPFFESLLTFPVFYPINEAFINEVGDSYGTTIDSLLYNGPFYLSEWKIGEGHRFLKNNHYWDSATVNLDEVYYRMIIGADNNTIVNLYLDGLIDIAGLSGENVEKHKNREDAIIVTSPVIFFITFNIDNHGQNAGGGH